MKKVLRIVMILLLTVKVLLCGALAAGVDYAEVCMPKIDISFFPETDISGLDISEISASLDGEELAVNSIAADERGIFCVFMLDVSRSMPDEHFNAAKKSIANVYNSLRPQDKMALIACGSQVYVVLNGDEENGNAEDAIMALENNDANTMFYSGIDSMIHAVQSRTDMRTFAVVISDGVDDTNTGLTRDQLVESMTSSGVVVNGLCVDTVSQTSFDVFHDTVSVSSGDIRTFSPDNIEGFITGKISEKQNLWTVSMSASNNIADGNEKLLSVKLGDIDTIELAITPKEWTPDTEPPKVVSASYDMGKNFLNIEYSEDVSGAEKATSYFVTQSTGEQIAVASVDGGNGNTYKIYLAQPLSSGSVISLSIIGPKDTSMESNPLEEFTTEILCGYSLPTTQEPSEPVQNGIGVKTIIIICAGFAAVAIVLIFVIATAANKKNGDMHELKNQKPAEKKKKIKKKAVKSTATFVFEDNEDEPKK